MSDHLIVSMRAEAMLARLAGSQDRLRENLRTTITRRSITVQAAVKADKLSGQVLHVRSGTLRRSINRRIDESASGVIATVGTNVRYAAAQEYGFDGDVTVRAHTRRSALQLSAKRKDRVGKSDGLINVRSFTRHMHLPERSFLRSTLKEQAPEIRQELRTAILEAVRL